MLSVHFLVHMVPIRSDHCPRPQRVGASARRGSAVMTKITIVSEVPRADGWYPILHMQRLMAELLDAEVHDASAKSVGRVEALLNGLAPKRRRDDHVGIFVVRSPHDARKLVPTSRALGGFARSLIWIIDSFETEATLHHRRVIDRHFDLVAFTQSYDTDFYGKLFGSRALCLEWGSDALNFGGAEANRDIDLLRLGRQPPSWENDVETECACIERGLRFAGRPPSPDVESGTLMQRHFSRAKFVLAHSNLAAPAPYTHPTKAYITARWTDSLASGATIAGAPPEDDLSLLDWSDALLPIPPDDRDAGLDRIASAAAAWTPQVAKNNYLGALRKLDWRLRYRELASALQISAPRLDQSLGALEARIDSLTSAP